MDITLENIIDKKCYLGTLKRKANPKTRDYWLDVKNNMVILDPEKIMEQLKNAREKVQEARKNWQNVLVISDKAFIKDELEELCENEWIYYFSSKVPSGVITNFETVLSRIEAMNKLKKFIDSEDYEKLTKKERLTKIRELRKLEMVYKWVKSLTKRPDLVIILDGIFMSRFVEELKNVDVDNVVLASSDFNKRWDEKKMLITNINSYECVKFSLDFILKK